MAVNTDRVALFNLSPNGLKVSRIPAMNGLDRAQYTYRTETLYTNFYC